MQALQGGVGQAGGVGVTCRPRVQKDGVLPRRWIRPRAPIERRAQQSAAPHWLPRATPHLYRRYRYSAVRRLYSYLLLLLRRHGRAQGRGSRIENGRASCLARNGGPLHHRPFWNLAQQAPRTPRASPDPHRTPTNHTDWRISSCARPSHLAYRLCHVTYLLIRLSSGALEAWATRNAR